MLRELVKTGFAAGLHCLGIDRLVGISLGLEKMPLVLSYHRVVRNFERSAAHSIAPMLVSTDTLERHLDWLGRHYHFVSLDELAAELETPGKTSKPLASITFDDGYRDVYRNAYPLLTKKGIPAAVFVVTDLLGTDKLQIHDELYLLLTGALKQWQNPEEKLMRLFSNLHVPAGIRKKLRPQIGDAFRSTRIFLETMSQSRLEELIEELQKSVHIPDSVADDFRSLNWEMLEDMTGNGITVGSHTKSHALLANESPGKVLEEVRESRELLQERLKTRVDHFAYPDGRFNGTSVRCVAEAGFRYAYTTCMHQDAAFPMLTIPRRVLWENSCLNSFGNFSPSILSCQVNGIFDPAGKCQQDHEFGIA